VYRLAIKLKYGGENMSNILFVEDDDINLTVVKALLSSIGYKNIQLAKCAKQALELLSKPETKIDLILMDLGLPDLSGIELTKQIRQSNLPSKNIPIVALTGNSEEKAKRESLAAGMNGFLTKPVEPKILQSTLKDLLGTETTS
jgi:two-component system sensor histidine kinase/response regulator